MYFLAVLLYLCLFFCGDYRDTQSENNGLIESEKVEWDKRRPTAVKYIPIALAIAAAIVSIAWFGTQDRLKDFTYDNEHVARKLRQGISLNFEEILSQLVKSTRSGPLNVFICGIIIAGPMMVAKDTLEDLGDGRGCTGKSSRALKGLEEGRSIGARQIDGANQSATNARANQLLTSLPAGAVPAENRNGTAPAAVQHTEGAGAAVLDSRQTEMPSDFDILPSEDAIGDEDYFCDDEYITD